METAERWRTLGCFLLFAVVVLALCSRLAYLQGGRSVPNRLAVFRARNLIEPEVAARGTIVDRHGVPMAYDRDVMIVRAEFHARVEKGVTMIPFRPKDLLATRLASHLKGGVGDLGSRTELRETLIDRITSAEHEVLTTKSRANDYIRCEFLVSGEIDSHEVLRRLCEEEALWCKSKDFPGRLYIHASRGFVRTYPERESTRGLVGTHYTGKVWFKDAATGRMKVRQRVDRSGVSHDVLRDAATGLERCSGLDPAKAPTEAGFYSVDFKDSRRRRFWTPLGVEPPKASRLITTIDLSLQKLAQDQLMLAAEEVRKEPRYEGVSYKWGALVLVEIASGDVLAMASHHPGRKGVTPFAPVENVFQPGSVVKPLITALALERGDITWDQTFDCTPTMPGRRRRVNGNTRPIQDDHACDVLDVHDIIVNSSNIGAVYIGMCLGQQGFIDFENRYDIGRSTGLPLPHERRAGRSRKPEFDLATMSDAYFRRNTGASLSFGYELQITAVQLARAYLSMISGRRRALHLVSGAVDERGEHHREPDPVSEEFLSKRTVGRVLSAMSDVVHGEEERRTGRHLDAMLESLGREQPLIAAKTGTTSSTARRVSLKTAVFVGLAPTEAPRYLVVSVLRKERASRFYGGRYAAPPAGRLLLGALDAEQSATPPRDELVRARYEDRGASSVR